MCRSVSQCVAVCRSVILMCLIMRAARIPKNILGHPQFVTIRALQCGAVWCSVFQCSAICCSVLQRDALCCSLLSFVEVCVPYVYLTMGAERGGGLGSIPKKMYGEYLGDGVEYHLMSPTPRC